MPPGAVKTGDYNQITKGLPLGRQTSGEPHQTHPKGALLLYHTFREK